MNRIRSHIIYPAKKKPDPEPEVQWPAWHDRMISMYYRKGPGFVADRIRKSVEEVRERARVLGIIKRPNQSAAATRKHESRRMKEANG